MSELDLDAIEALCEAATEGPWRMADNQRWGTASFLTVARDWDKNSFVSIAYVWSNRPGDAELIALSRTLIPALVARVRELEGLLSLALDAMAIQDPAVYDELFDDIKEALKWPPENRMP